MGLGHCWMPACSLALTMGVLVGSTQWGGTPGLLWRVSSPPLHWLPSHIILGLCDHQGD